VQVGGFGRQALRVAGRDHRLDEVEEVRRPRPADVESEAGSAADLSDQLMSATVEANVLVYASNSDAPEQSRALGLLDHLARGPALVVLLWPTVMAYLRLATHPSVFRSPMSHAEAAANVDSLLAQPHVRVAGEGEDFWPTYLRVAGEVLPRGNLVPDAYLAAMAIESGCEWVSTDRDFARFKGLRWRHPLE
jgi:toxin-antitoxin system PIN domain toxin